MTDSSFFVFEIDFLKVRLVSNRKRIRKWSETVGMKLENPPADVSRKRFWKLEKRCKTLKLFPEISKRLDPHLLHLFRFIHEGLADHDEIGDFHGIQRP